MRRSRHRAPESSAEGTGFFERIFGGCIGAAAGAVLYVSFQVFALVPLHGPDRWALSGPLKWYVGIGGLLGLFLGLSFARWLWSYATGQFESETSGWGVLLVVLLVFVVVLAVAIKFASAA